MLACHKACLDRKKCRSSYFASYKRARYNRLRKLGFSHWICDNRSLSGYLNKRKYDLARAKTPERKQQLCKYAQKTRYSYLRKYGGSPSRSLLARTRWLESKEDLR